MRPFTDKQIELVETFADQAVIAIENVRLFDEVQARTARTERSAAAADRDRRRAEGHQPLGLRPADRARHAARIGVRLCDADMAAICRRDGTCVLRMSASYGDCLEDSLTSSKRDPQDIGRGSVIGRAVLESAAVQIADVLDDPEYAFAELQRRAATGPSLGVPLCGKTMPIGVFVLSRTEVRPFTARQIELVKTFADQAVIAIENVRLFEEVQARTRELARSLEDLRTAQDRLIQTEKLASLGQLTAGIAHEIKNPLNFVNNFSALSARADRRAGRGARTGAPLDEQDARPRSPN